MWQVTFKIAGFWYSSELCASERLAGILKQDIEKVGSAENIELVHFGR